MKTLLIATLAALSWQMAPRSNASDVQATTQDKTQAHTQAHVDAKKDVATTPPVPVQKPTPSGIYFLPAGAQPGSPPDYSNNPWTASYASGFALRSDWSLIEPSSGTFDWSLFDSGLASASAAGKKVSLSIAAGGFCPAWLTGAQTVTLHVTTHFNGGAQTSTSPFVVPWDPKFQPAWQAAVQAFGAKYDANPAVSYVYIGGAGAYIETFIIQTEPDYAAFNAAGGLASWTAATEKIIDQYAAAFPTTPFMLAIGNPINIPGDSNAQNAGLAALNQVIAYGKATYPGRFGLVDQGLSQASSVGSYKDGPIVGYGPCGFQMTATMGASLGAALTTGLALDPHGFFEVYKADCMNTANASALASAAAALK